MRKQTIIVLVAAVALAANSLACCVVGWPAGVRGSGRVVEETIEISDVTEVVLGTSGNLYVEYGDEASLLVEAEDNLVEYLDIHVHGDTLEIKTQAGTWLNPTRPIKFYLTVTELDAVSLTGSGDALVPDMEADQIELSVTGSGDLQVGDLDAERIELDLSGSGDLEAEDCEADEASIHVTGSGDVDLRDLHVGEITVRMTGSGNVTAVGGEVEKQDVSITGSGDYTADGVKSDEAKVRLTGSGMADVRVSERLNATILGSGDVHYVGDAEVESSTTGSGDVRKGND